MIIRPSAIPREVGWTVAAIAFFGLVTSNPLATLAAAAFVPIPFLFLWRVGEPPVLLFAIGYQWLQVFMPILNANISGSKLDDLTNGGQLESAAYLGLLALVVLAIGMRLGRGRRRLDLRNGALAEGVLFNPVRLGLAFLLAQIVGYGANEIGAIAGGLRQALLVLDVFKSCIVFIIIWAALIRPRLRGLAIAVVVVEVVMGLMGFFSGFREVFLLATIAVLTAVPRPRRLLSPAFASILAVLLIIAVFWQSVKVDYRWFMNQGTGAQVILVSPRERIEFLADRVVSLDWEQARAGLQSGAERTGYLEYFGSAIETVPERIPYQQGRLWGEAIRHVLTPRLFFPNKPAIDDASRVNEFTGQQVAGAAEGTSISLGYVGESYVDFGPSLMFIPIFFLGVFLGWAYTVLATTGSQRLLSLAFAVSFILSNALLFESSNIKIVGGALTSLIVIWGLLRFGSDWIWAVLTGTFRRGAIGEV